MNLHHIFECTLVNINDPELKSTLKAPIPFVHAYHFHLFLTKEMVEDLYLVRP